MTAPYSYDTVSRAMKDQLMELGDMFRTQQEVLGINKTLEILNTFGDGLVEGIEKLKLNRISIKNFESLLENFRHSYPNSQQPDCERWEEFRKQHPAHAGISYPDFLCHLGTLYLDTGDYYTAAERFEAAVKSDLNHKDASQGWAKCLAENMKSSEQKAKEKLVWYCKDLLIRCRG